MTIGRELERRGDEGDEGEEEINVEQVDDIAIKDEEDDEELGEVRD